MVKLLRKGVLQKSPGREEQPVEDMVDLTTRTYLAAHVQMSNTASCLGTSSLTLIPKQHTLTFLCQSNLMSLLASLCPSKSSEKLVSKDFH